jgi:membrane fusion protein, multidrug efflux system
MDPTKKFIRFGFPFARRRKSTIMKRSLWWIGILVFSVFISCSGKKDDEHKAPSVPAGPKFQLVKVVKTPLSESVKLPAQLAAYEEVSIFPKVNGYVKSVFVDIGSHVKKGDVLMILEAPELQQAVVQAKERWARAISDFTIDRENYQRLKEAAQTPGAISPLDLATAKSKSEADSSLSNAEKANWQMQSTMMDYLTVTAPFSGVITLRNVHPGALVSAEAKDKPMLELKEVDHLRLQVDVPEGMAAHLKDRDSLSFYLSAFPGKKFAGRISRRSMNVNLQYRSERIELDVYNSDGSLAPGMYADAVLNARGNPDALRVPKSAVLTTTERKYVLLVKEGKIHQVDVSTGNETVDQIEVYGNLQAGDEIIGNPTDEIREGATLP